MKLDATTQGKRDNDVRKRTVPSLRGTQEARLRKKVENASQADSSRQGFLGPGLVSSLCKSPPGYPFH